MSGFSPRIGRSSQILYTLYGADMNTTADQVFTKLHNFPAYTLFSFRVRNASISLTTAAGGIYTGAAKSGIIIVAASQAYSQLTAPGRGISLSSTNEGFGQLTAGNLFFSLTTPQGAAATCDIEILGWEVP